MVGHGVTRGVKRLIPLVLYGGWGVEQSRGGLVVHVERKTGDTWERVLGLSALSRGDVFRFVGMDGCIWKDAFGKVEFVFRGTEWIQGQEVVFIEDWPEGAAGG